MATRLAKKVLLVSWDAADWSIVEPLLAQGLLPNLQRLINRGASGKIASVAPMLSPPAWTSVATGKRPHKHGVHGMLESDEAAGGIRPASSASRTTKAIWNILTQNGIAAHVVGWPAAHPAEPVNGVNVTDHHAIARVEFGKPWPQPEGSVHPPELAPTFAALRLHPQQLDRETLSYFVPDLDRIDITELGRLAACTRGLAASITTHAAATWALEHRPWDFAAVCYTGMEMLSHAYLRFMPPLQEGVSAKDFANLQHVVPACYRFHDLMLGRLLELAGEETTVILLSDHGCKTGTMRPPRIGGEPEDVEHWHRRFGLCVMAGPPIKPGVPLNQASILDVTPTILTLFGLPCGADMDGRPLFELFSARVEVEPIDSWDVAPGPSDPSPAPSPQPLLELQGMLAQLKNLGFQDPQEERLAAEQERVAATNRLNLARSLVEGGQFAEAIEILEELAIASPSSMPVASMLVEALLLANRSADALQIVDHLPPVRADAPWINLARGRIELDQGRPQVALEYLRRAGKADETNIRVHIFSGQAYLSLRQWSDARRAFQCALEHDSDHAEAMYGLCVVSLREGDAPAALHYATTAIESHELPLAYYHRGFALMKLGRHSEAASDFEHALSLSPNLRIARRLLQRLNPQNRG